MTTEGLVLSTLSCLHCLLDMLEDPQHMLEDAQYMLQDALVYAGVSASITEVCLRMCSDLGSSLWVLLSRYLACLQSIAADSRHAVREGHDDWTSHVEQAVNGDGFSSAIMQHHCPAKEGAEKGTDFGRTHDPFFFELTEVELISYVEQCPTN